jgi:alpha-N-acetylglucosamine transferase
MDKKTLKRIKKIKIICGTNDNFQKVPNDMIDSNGNKNYAYVTTVMLGDKYVAPAIVLAESIRKLGSMADLVVLITKDVSYESIEILKKFYDSVINVEYINFENYESKIEGDVTYLDIMFSKLNALNLVQYKKILLIDADTIIIKYPDHLFSLETPAGVFLPNKEEIITYDKFGKYKYNKKIEWFEKYCKYCSHGKKIPKFLTDKIEEGLKNKTNKNGGICGGLLLLEPSKEEFNAIMKDINISKTRSIIKEKLIWPEQQYLGMRYSGLWTSIEPIFLGLQGFPHWSVLFGLQFSGEKPFVLESKYSIEERVKYEDFQIWYKFYRDIINRCPDLLDSKVLSEPNEVSKYFISQLSRKSIIFKSVLSSGISESVNKIFNVKIHANQYYYHINISKEYDNESINFAFENDSIPGMVAQIIKKQKSNYWNEINEKIKKEIDNTNTNTNSISLNKINLNVLNLFKNEDKLNLLFYFSKINSSVCIIMVITNEKNEQHFWLDNNLISNILYQKTINLSGSVLKNIMFNINQTYSYDERTIKLNAMFDNMTDYKIQLLFYKTIIDSELKGNNKDIFVFSDTNSKIRAMSILLNSNTLDKFINKQIVFIPEKKNKMYSTLTENFTFVKNVLMFQSLKKWIYNNYDGNNMDNIIISTELNLSDKKQMKQFVLIDTNVYSDFDEHKYMNIGKKKLVFMEVIFVYQNTKISKEYQYIVEIIHDSRHYYQLDGIKFFLQ